MPVRADITPGTKADCTQASALIRGICAEYLLTDKAYDSDAIVKEAQDRGMQVVIPRPWANRRFRCGMTEKGHLRMTEFPRKERSSHRLIRNTSRPRIS